MSFNVLLANGRIQTTNGVLGQDTAIGVVDGTIAAIGKRESLPGADRVIDLEGDVVLPGIIDCHVHTREPGDEHKEDWETITRAAAAGGVTTIIAMPNTKPAVDHRDHLEQVYDLASKRALVDYQSYGVITSDNLDQIRPLAEAGVAGYKVFLGTTFGKIEPPNDGELVEAMEIVADTGKRLGFHEENDAIITHLAAKAREAGHNRPIDHAHSRPVVAEAEAVSRTILFSEFTGCPVHMFHLSSGSGAAIVARGKERGVNVSAETSPHYLWFTEAVYEEKGNAARVQPPIRAQAEQDTLWANGIHGCGVDCIATDHAPHTDEEKHLDDPFHNTWESISGFVGVEVEVPAMLTFINEGRLSMEQWVSMHATRPAQLWGLYPQKGSLRVGADADFTVVDPDHVWTLNRADLHSRSTVTPFDGESFTGAVTMTIVRGEVVYDAGTVVGESGSGTRVESAGTVEAAELGPQPFDS